MKKILPLLLLTPTLANAECIPSPDCADMGYTEISCSGSFVRCPFDTSKLFCTPCDFAFQYDCTGDNIAGGVGNICAGKYASCECSSSEYSFSEGNCNCINLTPTDCIIGTIYYADGTCSNDYISCQNPVGVVVKDNELVMTINKFYMTWGGYGTDVPNLTNIMSAITAQSDYAGLEKTSIVTDYYGADADISSNGYGAVYCYNYAPANFATSKTLWYLPSAGELYAYVYRNYSVISQTYINKLGYSTMALFLWSTTEYNANSALNVAISTGSIGAEAKSAKCDVFCFLAI